MGEITRNPLCWPDNVARTAPHNRTHPQFADKSINSAINFVLAEVNRINARVWNYKDDSVIISTNLKLRADLLPRGDQGQPADTGAAVFFTLRFPVNGKWLERPCVITCDKWSRVEWNLWAIGKDIEAQRARARWGCGTLQQAFQGYLAIPEKCGGYAWWEILRIKSDATRPEIEAAYKALGKIMHPDKGGTHDAWVNVQRAYEQAMAAFR